MSNEKGCSRDELYRLVWSEPMNRIGERFGVSGSYLTRVCKTLNVPRPPLGYWSKLAVGKAPPTPALPDAMPGDPLDWAPGAMPERKPKPIRPSRPIAKAKPVPAPRIAPADIHPLVRGARALFENGRKVGDQAFMKPYKRLLLDLNASKPTIDRAMRLANELYNAFEARGRRVTIATADSQLRTGQVDCREAPAGQSGYQEHGGLWSPQRPTVVYIDTVAIGIAILETTERTLLRYISGSYVRESDYVPPKWGGAPAHSFTTTREIPSGRLRVVAYSPYGRVTWSNQWQETAKATLDVQTIVRAVEKMAPELVDRIEEAERQAEIAHQKWVADMDRYHRAEDRKRIEASFRESTEQLEQVIQQWTKVVDTERFLAGIEGRLAELTELDAEAVRERLALARSLLGSQDPLVFLRAWKAPSERYEPKYPDVGA